MKNPLENLAIGSEVIFTIIPVYQITYIESSSFGAYIVEDENEQRFSIKGTFVAPLEEGSSYQIKGKISMYTPKFGNPEKQVSCSECIRVRPISKKGIIAYLQTLSGMGKKAELIYENFKEESINALKLRGNEILKLKGVGKKSLEKWQKELSEREASEYVIVKLLEYGISEKQIKKLLEKYQDEILTKIEENPYMLAREVRGFGFNTCDKIARNMENFNPWSEYRLMEGIVYDLEQATMEGHCFIPFDELCDRVKGFLEIKLNQIEMARYEKQHAADFEAYSGMGYVELQRSFAEEGYLEELQEKLEKERGFFEFEVEIASKAYKVNCLSMVRTLHSGQNMPGHVVTPITVEQLAQAVAMLLAQKRVVVDKEKIYLRKYFIAEQTVAKHVKRIMQNQQVVDWDIEKVFAEYCKENGYELEEKQKDAVLKFARSTGGLNLLIGSAGTGKTFTLGKILEMLKVMYKKVLKKQMKVMIMAPTGKASKVATKATGMECVTIHRGLGYDPINKGFMHNEENPLEADVVICDEMSMADIMLTKDLLSAIGNNTKIIFLGDIKQLPSVGAGNVLKDLIESNFVEVIELNVAKRQSELSGIHLMAQNIIQGNMIYTCNETKDMFVINRETWQGVHKTIVDSIKRLQTLHGWSMEDIQVLSPQRRGLFGVDFLNYILQQEFNPIDSEKQVLNKKIEVSLDGKPLLLELFFKKGDKVIHIKNNYDIPWYRKKNGTYVEMGGDNDCGITNGESGVVDDILVEKDSEGNTTKTVVVRYDDMYIQYSSVDEIEHAYCLTIHKSQGSAFEGVIIPIMSQTWNMLERNLIYTAVTRARQFCAVIGQDKAIKHSIRTLKSVNRYTNLVEQIQRS